MSQDNTFENHNAKAKPIGLDETQKIQGRFNQETYIGQQIAEASPEAKRMVADQLYMEDRQMEAEQKKQDRSREFRQIRAENKRYEQFFNSPQPIPSDPAAKKLINETIVQEAAREVREKDQYYMERIPDQTERNVSDILRMDRDGTLAQRFEHAHDQKQGN